MRELKYGCKQYAWEDDGLRRQFVSFTYYCFHYSVNCVVMEFKSGRTNKKVIFFANYYSIKNIVLVQKNIHTYSKYVANVLKT